MSRFVIIFEHVLRRGNPCTSSLGQRLWKRRDATRSAAIGSTTGGVRQVLRIGGACTMSGRTIRPPIGLIEARELTQAELSRGAQVPRTTINEILAGRRGISKTNALRLANFFGVTTEEFIAE
jgi:DNA-binding XRE family transcriptional regulator